MFNEIFNSNSLEQNLTEVINLDFVDEAKTKQHLINLSLLLSLRARNLINAIIENYYWDSNSIVHTNLKVFSALIDIL